MQSIYQHRRNFYEAFVKAFMETALSPAINHYFAQMLAIAMDTLKEEHWEDIHWEPGTIRMSVPKPLLYTESE